MRKTTLVLLILALAVPVFAVGKVTEDPNKAGAVAEAPAADLTVDTKLGQKVTYTVVKKTVSSVLDDLSKSTGVALRAGRNSSDWQVRDRKMNIYAKDVPLNQLMSSIARVMKFKWEIGGKEGEAKTYRLYMDRKSLLDAEAQRVRAEQKAEEEQAQRRQKGLMQYGQLHDMSPADKAKLKQDNPFMYFVANSGMGSTMGSFFSESPGALEAITTGQQFQVRGSSLSAQAQAGLLGAMQGMVSMEAKFSGGKARTTIPSDINMSSVNVQINRNLDMMKGMPQANMLLGDMQISYKGGSIDVPMMDPDSPMTKLIGKGLVMAEDTGRPLNECFKDLAPEFMSAMAKQIKTDAGGEPLIDHSADDPALHNKITLKDPGRQLPDVEKSLADASKMTVVSDFFGGWNFPLGQVPATESELKDVLEKIGDTYTYNWDKHSAILELRDRNWFKKRAAQIPEAWLEAWRDELTKKGTIDVDDLAQIAALTQEQISVNLMSDDILKNVVGSVYSAREILRLYAALSSDQRSMLLSDSGLPFRSLTQDQWSQAQKTIQTRGGGTVDFNRQCYIVGTRKAVDRIYEYKFTLYDGNKTELASWSLSTPGYAPPPPPKDTAPAKPGDQKAGDAAKPSDSPKPTPAAQPAAPAQPK